ncbi:phospholipase C, phosphocholine-specific [Fodinicola feengrottensis]|uniref:phospholipase C n=1 Tax=Fodinicola feengrottensis TaxID=435914 RepID=A0ABP4T9D3_9ACTN
MSRRRLLGMSAAAAGAGALGSLLPPSVHAAMAAPMQPGGLRAIDHVIVLMQENRSFDHYFGRLRGVRGFADRHPLALPGGQSAFQQPAAGRDPVLPFSLRREAEREGRPDTDIQYLGSLDHGWAGGGVAWSGGWNNGWIAAKTAATMTYYERQDIALQYELADTFTVCDAYHCSLFGPTNPNRNYLWSGKVGYEPDGIRRAVENDAYDYDHKGYSWSTYPERLEAAGVSWRVYQEFDNFTDNPLEFFLAFKNIADKVLAAAGLKYPSINAFYDELLTFSVDKQKALAAALTNGLTVLTAAERSLYDKALYRSETNSLVPRLRADIKAKKLPTVSWLVPSAVLAEHPGSSTPVGSANLIYDVLDAVASDVDTWSRTAIFLNFDENDGYFDHVPPPVPPAPVSGNSDDYYNGRPIGLGFRVPMTVISPWSIGGFVNSETFDHTSVLRFLERWTGVSEPNISPWRRTVAGDLTSAFDFRNSGRPAKLTHPGGIPAPITRWHPQPPATQALPDQEPGNRPARPLPYHPTVAIEPAAGGLTVELGNYGSRTTHFAIYSYAPTPTPPQHVDVRDRTVRPVGAVGPYQLTIQGPNRFWADAAGSTTGAAHPIAVRILPAAGRMDLQITLHNTGKRTLALALTARGYGSHKQQLALAPGQARLVSWPTSHGWYDVEITAPTDTTFTRRLTGRLEDGRPGLSG